MARLLLTLPNGRSTDWSAQIRTDLATDILVFKVWRNRTVEICQFP